MLTPQYSQVGGDTEGGAKGGGRRGGGRKTKWRGLTEPPFFIGHLGTSVAIPFYRQAVDCLLQWSIVYLSNCNHDSGAQQRQFRNFLSQRFKKAQGNLVRS